MVFLLGRMGDNKRALNLIIERLGDVHRVRTVFDREENFLISPFLPTTDIYWLLDHTVIVIDSNAASLWSFPPRVQVRKLNVDSSHLHPA